MNKKNTKKKNIPQLWFLVTNHLNLAYMLAAGMVIEPSEFNGKHYEDTLSVEPGWVPLFRDEIPTGVIDQVVSERKHLRPCVISLDLSEVSGSVKVFSKECKIRNAKYPNLRLGKNELGIFIRTPLPVTLLTDIYFRSDEDRQELETRVEDTSNVDLRPHNIKVDKSFFTNDTEFTWPSEKPKKETEKNKNGCCQLTFKGMDTDEIPATTSQTESVNKSGQALGGLFAMLYHCANRSELGVKVFQLVTEKEKASGWGSIHDQILAELPNWLESGSISADSEIPARLFWGVADVLSKEITTKDQAVNMVLKYLYEQLDQLKDEKNKTRLDSLLVDMKGLSGLGSKTITELLKNNKGSFSRPLLLFCLREDCRELLEFSNSLLSDSEYILSGILFGLRDRWIGLPLEIRNHYLCPYVISYMAAFSHKKQGDDFNFPEQPGPQPLRSLFPSSLEQWSQDHTDTAIELARASRWQDCIETEVMVPAGYPPLKAPREENGKFLFSGEIVTTKKIRHENFLKRLGQWPPVATDLEAKARESLNSKKMNGELDNYENDSQSTS